MSDEIVIEKGIPLPKHTHRKYPFRDMGVGDSFLVPDERKTAVIAAMSYFGKRNGMKFCSRIDNGHRRVWRIA